MKTGNNMKWGVILLAFFASVNIVTANAETTNVLSRSVIIRDSKEEKEYKNLTKDCITIKHNDTTYYQSKGRYYIAIESGYRLVAPPIGIKIDKLPKGYVTLSVLDYKYYCCRGIIYKVRTSGGYESVLPEVGMTLPELPEAGVREILIDGKLYFESEGLVYKEYSDGEQYVVVCTLASLDA